MINLQEETKKMISKVICCDTQSKGLWEKQLWVCPCFFQHGRTSQTIDISNRKNTSLREEFLVLRKLFSVAHFYRFPMKDGHRIIANNEIFMIICILCISCVCVCVCYQNVATVMLHRNISYSYLSLLVACYCTQCNSCKLSKTVVLI